MRTIQEKFIEDSSECGSSNRNKQLKLKEDKEVELSKIGI